MNKKNMPFIILIILFAFALFLLLKEVKIFKRGSFQQIEKYIQNREYDKAKRAYLEQIEISDGKEKLEAEFNLAKLYYTNRQLVEADLLFQKLYNSAKEDSNIYDNTAIYLVMLAESKGDCDLAIDYILRIKELRPHITPESNAFYGNIPLVLSRCYLKDGNEKKAKTILEDYFSKEVDTKTRTRALIQMGKNFLELGGYDEAIKYFQDKRVNEGLIDIQKKELNHFLCMANLGKKNYDKITEISSFETFFQGDIESLGYAFYSSAIADIKQNRLEEGREKLNKIYATILGRLDIKESYKFHYLNFLRYYGLGLVDVVELKYENAEKNFMQIIEIYEEISSTRYNSFIEKNNFTFLNLLAHYELAKLNYKVMGNIQEAQERISKASDIIDSLTEQEKRIIGAKEIGNEGSIIEKINKYKLELNEN